MGIKPQLMEISVIDYLKPDFVRDCFVLSCEGKNVYLSVGDLSLNRASN